MALPYYLRTAVRFAGHGTVVPCDDLAADGPPLGPLHVITAIQPDPDRGSADSIARLGVLDRELATAGIRAIPAVGASFDGEHQKDSRAVFGLSDTAARDWGRQSGQVAVFAWSGPRWSLPACAADRQEHRGWRWIPER